MSRSITVEGDLATVDLATSLTTQGSVTAPSRQVPHGMKKIDRIIVAVAQDSAAQGSATYFLRLGGTAVKNGEQVICIGAGGNIAVQSGSDAAPIFHGGLVLDDVDIDVSEGDVVNVQAEMDGQDLGTARVAVTLVFA